MVDGVGGRRRNDRLRAARKGLRSPSGSGRSMSRQELADACNQVLAAMGERQGRKRSRWAGMTASHVGSYERGEIRWPNHDYRAALRAVLHAGDWDLGFYIDRPDRDHPVEAAGRVGRAGGPVETCVTCEVGQAVGVAMRDLNRLDEQPVDERVRSGSTVDGGGTLSALRRGLMAYRWDEEAEQPSLAELRVAIRRANVAYQAARYSVLGRLSTVVASAERLAIIADGVHSERAFELLAWANLIASKLAAKLGDGMLAWAMADRAAVACLRVSDPALLGVAAYQHACALAKTPGGLDEARDVAMTAADQLARHREHATPRLLSVRGALLLHAAVTSARLGEPAAADRHLDTATSLAGQLGRDGNECQTAFGPTNVLLHRLAVAVALGHASRALDLGDRIDTSGMPVALVSRRAQVHVDLAAAYCRAADGDPPAVLHLLEAERIAPEIIGHHAEARVMITTLLSRERRSATPGLRPMAHRAGLL